MAVSFQCMTKSTTVKKIIIIKKKENTTKINKNVNDNILTFMHPFLHLTDICFASAMFMHSSRCNGYNCT